MNVLKRSFFFLLYFLSRILHPGENKNPVVLVYHSIADDDWFFSVRPREFKRQMKYIAQYCHPVALSDVFAWLEQKKELSPGSVAVTFDDGYHDFINTALPVLSLYRIPVTIFVMAGAPAPDALGAPADKKVITVNELQELSFSPLVEIGSHGLTHQKLRRLDQASAAKEISVSRKILGEALDKLPRFFAYPKGSFDDKISDMVRLSGYEGAVTVEQRSVSRGDSPFQIPRIQVDSSTSFGHFKAKLSRASDWYYSIWRFWRQSC